MSQGPFSTIRGDCHGSSLVHGCLSNGVSDAVSVDVRGHFIVGWCRCGFVAIGLPDDSGGVDAGPVCLGLGGGWAFSGT